MVSVKLALVATVAVALAGASISQATTATYHVYDGIQPDQTSVDVHRPHHGVRQRGHGSRLRRLRPDLQHAHQRPARRASGGQGRQHLRFVAAGV
jgi:hypothetical protein